MSELFALVDCNSFYCSCEQLFAPQYKNKPVVVLSNNDGCVISRTNEAKALGIPMGAIHYQIKEKVERDGIKVFSSNYTLYGDLSSRVMKTLAKFTPCLEVYSIDEAFLDLDGFQDVENYARKIKETVQRDVGIPVSIGIGPTKVLAKVANKIAKKNKIYGGVFDLSDPKTCDEILRKFPVSDLWGIGSKSAEKLKRIGIHTADDLRKANENTIDQILTVVGKRILNELRGVSCLPLEELADPRKQLVCARGFGKSVTTYEELEEALATYISSASERLRKEDSICSMIQVFVQTNPFKKTPQYFNHVSIPLLSGTAAAHRLVHFAKQGLKKIYRPGFKYKRVGIVLSELHPKNQNQLSFDIHENHPKDEAVMNAMDKINKRMGPNTLYLAACGIRKDWKMLSQMRSRYFTTRWSDLLEVN